VIEGLRVLPWLQDAQENEPYVTPTNCKDCHAETGGEAGVQLRREMGCGYEAPLEEPGSVWAHRGMTERPRHCSVYTTSLPDVTDIALSVVSCGQGGLATLPVLCGGANPPRSLIGGCQILNGAMGAQQSWKNDPKNREKK